MSTSAPPPFTGLRRDAAHGVIVFLLVFTTYFASAPHGVMLDDDGYFILAAYFNGVAHPPGYPLYTLLAHLGTYLPVGTIAFRVHLVSALFGALACGCLWKLAHLLLASRIYAYAAALAFGFSRTFWSQSIIAEVYTLNALLFFGLLFLCMAYTREPDLRQRDQRPYWIAFLYGLSLTNHWPLMLLSSPALAAVLWPKRRFLLARAPALIGLALLGLLPYLWMAVRSQLSEISFDGPIESWSDFWYYLSRKGYSDIDHSTTAGWWDKVQFAGYALGETARQFGPFGAVLAALGFVRQWQIWPLRVCLGLALAYFANTFLLIGLLDFNFDLENRNVFHVYPLPAFGAASLWLALGLKDAVDWSSGFADKSVRRGLLQYGAAIGLVLTTWIDNAPANIRTGDNRAGDYAATVLQTLPPHATLFLAGDYSVGPIAYLNKVERLRPDVTLMHFQGQLFSNRLYKPRFRPPEIVETAIDDYLNARDLPVYYFPGLPHRYGSIFYGLYFEVWKGAPGRVKRVIGLAPILQYFERALSGGEPSDTSELIQHRYLTALYCSVLASVVEFPSGAGAAGALSEQLAQRCNGYYGLTRRVEIMLAKAQPDFGSIRELLHRAERHADEIVRHEDLATLYHLLGLTHHLSGDERTAATYFAKSIAVRPYPDNPSYRYYRKPRRAGADTSNASDKGRVAIPAGPASRLSNGIFPNSNG